jgi:hypothetical protein
MVSHGSFEGRFLQGQGGFSENEHHVPYEKKTTKKSL